MITQRKAQCTKKIALYAAFLCIFSITGYGQTFLTQFPNQKPKQILNDQKNRFFVDFSSSIAVFSNQIDYNVKPHDPNPDYGSSSFDNAVSSQGTVYSIFKSSYTPKKSKTTYYHLFFATCPRHKCKYKRLARWSYTSGSKSHISYTPSSLRVSEKNGIFFTVEYYHNPGGKNARSSRKTSYYFNGKSTNQNRYHRLLTRHYPPPSSGVTIANEISFQINGKNKSPSEDRSSRYTRSVVWDANKFPHVFFHDSGDKSFYHRFYSKEKNQSIEIPVDGPESGQENVVFISGKKMWSIHYFYRDAFHKGLLVTIHHIKTGKIIRQFVIDASKTRNSGWDLVGGQSSAKRILFTYLSNKHENKREFVLLNKVEELENIGKTFTQHGHPKGKGNLSVDTSDNKRQVIQDLASSHLKETRMFQLNIGTGIQYITWDVNVAVPNENSGVKQPYKPEYQFSDASLNIYSLEGKYGRTNFGIELVTKLIDKEVKQVGSTEAKKINQFKGQLGWERLFFDFDVKLQVEQTASTVFFEDQSNQVPPKTFDMEFKEIKLNLLTFKRHHFGLLYQTYNFFQPVYIYLVPAGSTAYQFDSQAIGEIDVTNWVLHYGYSTLDYLVKFESAINEGFIDGEIRGGLSFADFNGEMETTGKKPDSEYTFLAGIQLEVGWIWYKRWESLNQLGGVIKVSYRVDYSKIGSSDKPDNKDEASDADNYYFAFERTELRHGPILFVSLNF